MSAKKNLQAYLAATASKPEPKPAKEETMRPPTSTLVTTPERFATGPACEVEIHLAYQVTGFQTRARYEEPAGRKAGPAPTFETVTVIGWPVRGPTDLQ